MDLKNDQKVRKSQNQKQTTATQAHVRDCTVVYCQWSRLRPL